MKKRKKQVQPWQEGIQLDTLLKIRNLQSN